MEDNIEEQLDEVYDEYTIVSKNKNDILNELNFKDEEERILCDSIITNLEKSASEAIRNMKVAQLPYIGCVRINPIKRKLRDAKLHLKDIRKNLTKEQYKEHVRSFIIDLKEKQKEEDKIKLIFTRIRRNNKKKYEELYKKLGKSYAELFIYSIYWLKEVPFDIEWQEHYDELASIDRNKLNAAKKVEETDIVKNILNAQPRYRFK